MQFILPVEIIVIEDHIYDIVLLLDHQGQMGHVVWWAFERCLRIDNIYSLVLTPTQM